MRDATQHDVPAIMEALLALQAKSTAPHMALATPIDAELGVRNAIHEGRAVIAGDYFIMYDVGSPWYTRQYVLIEEIILRISRACGSVIEDALAALDELQMQHNCVAIAAGDTQIGYMLPKYIAHGYRVMGHQLLKG